MNIWFTSDTHFGHKNIIKFCDRPFSDVEEMDERLIENWNDCVKPGDRIYHLGDVSFAREPGNVLRRLNGEKYLIRGNHDNFKQSTELKKYFVSVKEYHNLRVGKQNFILFHYPIRNWHHCYKGSIHLFGHSHGKTEDYGKSTDIGVDCWDYRPVNLDEIVKYMKNKESIKHH